MPYDNLRKGRLSLSGHIYHITINTWERNPWFQDLQLGRIAVLEMRYLEDINLAKTYAWVLMPDHLHWLVQLNESSSLQKIMHDFKGRSSRKINQRLQRSGSFWQRAYHDHLIRDDENLIEVARYIVANPLRAGLVRKIGDYSLWDAIWL